MCVFFADPMVPMDVSYKRAQPTSSLFYVDYTRGINVILPCLRGSIFPHKFIYGYQVHPHTRVPFSEHTAVSDILHPILSQHWLKFKSIFIVFALHEPNFVSLPLWGLRSFSPLSSQTPSSSYPALALHHTGSIGLESRELLEKVEKRSSVMNFDISPSLSSRGTWQITVYKSGA